jgi:hypothetical protein
MPLQPLFRQFLLKLTAEFSDGVVWHSNLRAPVAQPREFKFASTHSVDVSIFAFDGLILQEWVFYALGRNK